MVSSMTPSSVSLGVYQANLADPDAATRETIDLMCGLIHAAANDAAVQQCAGSAVRQFHGGPLYAGINARMRARMSG